MDSNQINNAVKEGSEETVNKKAKDLSQKMGSKKYKIMACVISLFLIVIVFLLGTVVGLFLHFYSLMDTSNHEDDYSHTISYSDGTVTLPEEDIHSDSNIMNILLIGTDERTQKFDPYARADSIMILSLNKKSHAVKLVSLERGMTVRVSGNIPNVKNDLLTHTFHYGGAKLVMKTVNTHFNLDVTHYVRVNFTVFEKLVNQVGGVDIVLTEKEAEALNRLLKSEFQKGKNHLDGHSALHYSRLRSIDSDWKRIQRQRKVIASLKKNMKNKSLIELNDIANHCFPYVQTNLTSLEIADLLLNLSDYAKGDFGEMTIPKKGTFNGLGDVNFKENSRILHEFLYGN